MISRYDDEWVIGTITDAVVRSQPDDVIVLSSGVIRSLNYVQLGQLKTLAKEHMIHLIIEA